MLQFMMFCFECGKKVETAWKFCQNCGNKLKGISINIYLDEHKHIVNLIIYAFHILPYFKNLNRCSFY